MTKKLLNDLSRENSLLNNLSRENSLQLDSILSSGIPWLKLDLEIPKFSIEVLNDAVESSVGWHSQWDSHYAQPDPSSQTDSWDGKVLFGPKNWNEWTPKILSDRIEDEPGLAKKYRRDLDFAWHIDIDHPVRKWVNSFLDDDAINLVSYYVLGPQGYIQPHYDNTTGNKWLNKMYAAIAWPDGCEFGFLDWGNAPIQEGDVFLINNYQHSHWVINRGTQPRIVMDINCDLTKIQDLIKRSFLRR